MFKRYSNDFIQHFKFKETDLAYQPSFTDKQTCKVSVSAHLPTISSRKIIKIELTFK